MLHTKLAECIVMARSLQDLVVHISRDSLRTVTVASGKRLAQEEHLVKTAAVARPNVDSESSCRPGLYAGSEAAAVRQETSAVRTAEVSSCRAIPVSQSGVPCAAKMLESLRCVPKRSGFSAIQDILSELV